MCSIQYVYTTYKKDKSQQKKSVRFLKIRILGLFPQGSMVTSRVVDPD
jgi:hypothetical protein